MGVAMKDLAVVGVFLALITRSHFQPTLQPTR